MQHQIRTDVPSAPLFLHYEKGLTGVTVAWQRPLITWAIHMPLPTGAIALPIYELWRSVDAGESWTMVYNGTALNFQTHSYGLRHLRLTSQSLLTFSLSTDSLSPFGTAAGRRMAMGMGPTVMCWK